MQEKELLIISNNVLSNTRNNGKTILSYIEDVNKSKVHQLYFSNEKPEIEDIDYFRIADRDIIVGKFNIKRRGNKVEVCKKKEKSNIESRRIPRNEFTRTMREFLWLSSWRSGQLERWLDKIYPQVVLFMAGDSGFAYTICEYIVNKYQAKQVIYITDDYVLPRKKETFVSAFRRIYIKKKMEKGVRNSDMFFTISELMREEYRFLFGVDSECIVNMSPSLKDSKLLLKTVDKDEIVLVYTGSLYYGREEILLHIGKAIKKYNEISGRKKAYLNIYSNASPDEKTKKRFNEIGTCKYKGSLNREELKRELNISDILVFVESFDMREREKTRLSLSTKIPEYLSVEKPIFAAGPADIASMRYLADVAICANCVQEIYDKLNILLSSKDLQESYAKKAEEKYENYHDCKIVRTKFINKLFAD